MNVLRRILILSVAGLGDFVLGTPALRAIREHFPHASIWILTIPEVSELAERCPYVNTVRTLDLRRARSELVWGVGAIGQQVLRLIREFRGIRFDLAINLYKVETRLGGLRMAAFLRAANIQRTVGRWSEGRAIGFDLVSRDEGHEIDAQLGVVRLVGATPTSVLPELWVIDHDRAACDSLLDRHEILQGDRIVCLHAGAGQPEKRWPHENFIAVGRRLAVAGACILLIGGRDDRELCLSLAEAIPGAASLAGETSLPVLAALLQRSTLLVTNDSGPMHMAVALGVPLVVPFGPSSPDRFGPRGRETCVIFSAPQHTKRQAWWHGVPAQTVSDAAVRLFSDMLTRSGALDRSQ